MCNYYLQPHPYVLPVCKYDIHPIQCYATRTCNPTICPANILGCIPSDPYMVSNMLLWHPTSSLLHPIIILYSVTVQPHLYYLPTCWYGFQPHHYTTVSQTCWCGLQSQLYDLSPCYYMYDFHSHSYGFPIYYYDIHPNRCRPITYYYNLQYVPGNMPSWHPNHFIWPTCMQMTSNPDNAQHVTVRLFIY